MPKRYSDEQVEREAWRMLLNGAESHWEDDIDEGGKYPEDVYEKILDRCGDLIKRLRKEHDAPWADPTEVA